MDSRYSRCQLCTNCKSIIKDVMKDRIEFLVLCKINGPIMALTRKAECKDFNEKWDWELDPRTMKWSKKDNGKSEVDELIEDGFK